MKTMKLGKTGVDISRIGLGTWSIGGGSAWGGDHELQIVLDTIREAPKLGVNLLDTAPGYNFGNSEEILGKALKTMKREEVVIITKCGVTIQAYSPLEMGLLSGTFPRDYKPVGAQIPKKWFQPENMQAAMDMMDQWQPLCEKYGCTIANLALGWIIAQGDFINLLSGSTTVSEIEENIRSAEIEIDAEDVALMREMAETIDR